MINEKAAWCGLDISKNKFDAAFHPAEKNIAFAEIPTRAFPRSLEGMQTFYDWLDALESSDGVRIIMEATGRYSLEIASWMIADRPEYRPAIVNPRHAAAYHTSLGLRNKTDQVDCRALAKMGVERNPPAYQPLSPVRESLQALTRQRVAYVEERTATKNRMGECVPIPFLQKLHENHIEHLEKAIARIERELKDLLEKDERISHDMVLLQSIPGVGFVTAVTVVAELGDLAGFTRSRQVTSMVGVSPQIHTSGTSVHGRTKLSKQGNVHVRNVLYMAAKTAAMWNPHMAAVYQRLREKGKSHKSALGAVMRKLLVLMRALIIGRNMYDPEWKPGTVVIKPEEWRSELNPKLRFVPK